MAKVVDLTTRAALTVAETAEVTGLGVRNVQSLVARGELASTKLGGRRLVLAAALRERLGVTAGERDPLPPAA